MLWLIMVGAIVGCGLLGVGIVFLGREMIKDANALPAKLLAWLIVMCGVFIVFTAGTSMGTFIKSLT